MQPVLISAVGRAIGAVSLLVGLAILSLSGSWIHRNHLDQFLFQSVQADGQVIENRATLRTSRASRTTSYRAIVKFQDREGRPVTFAEPIAWSPPSFQVGESVGVLYDPRDSERAMIDRGGRNYLMPGYIALFGGAFVLGGLQRLRRG
jgi:hypothetical protein